LAAWRDRCRIGPDCKLPLDNLEKDARFKNYQKQIDWSERFAESQTTAQALKLARLYSRLQKIRSYLLSLAKKVNLK
jgi:hypothetical protein